MGDPLEGRLVDGRYRIGARIARGGMASVYEATDLRLDRACAIKVMHAGLGDDEEFAARFVREARSAARLDHPNVVAVYDQGDDDGLVFLAMEYVAGHTLRDVIHKESPMSPSRALALVEPVLSALASAHRAGLIHRDIKPENVLIADDGRVKVADFGLAKPSEGGATISRAGAFMGTPGYVAPEQINGQTAGARTDIYSLGITAYQLLTGQLPFRGDKLTDLFWHHANTPLPSPRDLNPDVSIVLAEFVRSMAAKLPEQRPESMHTVAMALQQMVPRAGLRAASRLGGASNAQLTAISMGSDDGLAVTIDEDDPVMHTVASAGRATMTPPAATPPAPVLLTATRATTTTKPRRKRRRGTPVWMLLVVIAIGIAVVTQVPEVRDSIWKEGEAPLQNPIGWLTGGPAPNQPVYPAVPPIAVWWPEYDPPPAAHFAPRIERSYAAPGTVVGMAINSDSTHLIVTGTHGVAWIDAQAKREMGDLPAPPGDAQPLAAFVSRRPGSVVVMAGDSVYRYTYRATGNPLGSDYVGADESVLPAITRGCPLPHASALMAIVVASGHAAVFSSKPDTAPRVTGLKFPGMPDDEVHDVLAMPDGRTLAVIFRRGRTQRLAFYRTSGPDVAPLGLVSIAGGDALEPRTESYVAGRRTISLETPVRVFGATVDSRHLLSLDERAGPRHMLVGTGTPDPDDLRDDPPAPPCTGVALWSSLDDDNWGSVSRVWLRDMDAGVTDAIITPQGEFVFVALTDGRVCVLDGHTGKDACEPLRPAGTFAPSAPMRLLADPLGQRVFVGANQRVFAIELYPE